MTISRRYRVQTPLAIVHTSRFFDQIDIQERHGLRVTSASRTIIDLAGRCGDGRLSDAIDSAIRDGHTSEDFLTRRMWALAYAGRPGAERLARLLGIRSGGLHSVLEREFKAMLDLAGIPVESQVVVEGADGAIRVDFKVLGFAMILEANGHRTHSTRAALARDARRTRIAFDTESALVVFTFSEIFGQPANVQAELFAIAVKLGVRSGSRPAQP